MLRFTRILFVLPILCAMLITAAQYVGASRSSPLNLLFSNPDGSPCKLPCLFGIRPGETSVDDALAMLDIHPLAHRLDVFRQHKPLRERQPQLAAPTIAIEVTPNNVVDSIVLTAGDSYGLGPSSTMNNDTLALTTAFIGDAFVVLGEPPSAGLTSFWNSYRWINYTWQKWSDQAIFILAQIPRTSANNLERVQIENPIWVIEVYSMTDCPRDASPGFGWHPWLGFTTKPRYDVSPSITASFRPLESEYYSVLCRKRQTKGSP